METRKASIEKQIAPVGDGTGHEALAPLPFLYEERLEQGVLVGRFVLWTIVQFHRHIRWSQTFIYGPLRILERLPSRRPLCRCRRLLLCELLGLTRCGSAVFIFCRFPLQNSPNTVLVNHSPSSNKDPVFP